MYFEKYYEQVDNIHVNTCPNRAYYVPSSVDFPCENMEDSSRVTMLSGEDWAFKLYDSPYDVEKFFELGFDESKYDAIAVPSCWQMLGYDKHQYANVVYPFPYDPPYVPHQNPSGAYITYFDMTADELKKKNYLNFEGVDSCYYVWINGEFVGFSQVSHSTSEFDVSDFLCEGENKLAVLVLKWCVGSYFEDQDKLRMSGIFRDVYIITRPENHIRDYYIKTPLDKEYKDGKILIDAKWNKDAVKNSVKLYDPEGDEIASTELVDGKAEFEVKDAKLWNAETPYQYTVVFSTDDEVIIQKVGMKSFEIKDGVYYVNGVNIKVKGTNRHDSDPFTGYVISREHLINDLKLMKQHNINGIRTSHYPNAPWATQYFSEFGFYVTDESDVEMHGTIKVYGGGHEYNYFKEFCDDRTFGTLNHDPLYEGLILDRIQRNVERDKNNACVILWSLGNESGYGPNLEKAAAWIKTVDENFYVHYESSVYQKIGYKNDVSNIDVFSRMYANTESIDVYMNGMIKKPFIQCEFVCAMGNGPGDVEDYFEQIYKYDGFMGGYVWEWCDHAVYHGKTADGRDQYYYGGDWGEFPNEGSFCVDGLVYPDRTPHMGLLEWKNVARPARVKMLDAKTGKVLLSNKLDFLNLKDAITAYYEVSQNGDVVATGEITDLDLAPHCDKEITLSYDIPETGDIYVRVIYLQKEDSPFVEAGYEVGFDQLKVREEAVTFTAVKEGKIEVSSCDKFVSLEGKNFRYTYGKLTGTFTEMVKDNMTILDKPMELNVWRAPTENDRKIKNTWSEAGYDRAWVRTYDTTIEEEDGAVTITTELSIASVYRQKFLSGTVKWIVTGDGTVKSEMDFDRDMAFPHLPRFGIRMFLPKVYTGVEYFGYGPNESYIDKQRASYYGHFVDKVENMHEDYILPQENCSHMGCKEVSAIRGNGYKVTAKGDGFSFNISEYTQEMLTEKLHNFEIEKSGYTVLCLDSRMGGVGSNSCGPELKPQYQVNEEKITLSLELSFGK